MTTRRYPVDLTRMSEMLRKDLQENYDLAIHLGQSPGSTVISLEAVGLNVRSDGSPLIQDAPEAYRSPLSLASMQSIAYSRRASRARFRITPGTYLCNAALYLSQHYFAIVRPANAKPICAHSACAGSGSQEIAADRPA